MGPLYTSTRRAGAPRWRGSVRSERLARDQNAEAQKEDFLVLKNARCARPSPPIRYLELNSYTISSTTYTCA